MTFREQHGLKPDQKLSRAEYRRLGILNPCLCEFCHLGFSETEPNMGFHADYHQACHERVIQEQEQTFAEEVGK